MRPPIIQGLGPDLSTAPPANKPRALRDDVVPVAAHGADGIQRHVEQERPYPLACAVPSRSRHGEHLHHNRDVHERYLRDLRGLLETNVDEARRLLALAVEKIVLVREGPQLVAAVRGNMAGLLEISGCVNSVGAGRGI